MLIYNKISFMKVSQISTVKFVIRFVNTIAFVAKFYPILM